LFYDFLVREGAIANDKYQTIQTDYCMKEKESVARILPSHTKEEKEALEDKLWFEFLYDVGSWRHLLNGETEPERWEEMRARLTEKWDITIQRKSKILKHQKF
jgi:hypothetical protein